MVFPAPLRPIIDTILLLIVKEIALTAVKPPLYVFVRLKDSINQPILHQNATFGNMAKDNNLLKKWMAKVRAESFQKEDGDYSIGRTYVKYIDEEDAERYIKMGCNIRRITLDDLFVTRGVEIEP